MHSDAFDPTRYAEGIRRRNELERREIALRAEAARAEAQSLAAEIAAADAAVRKVYLFGSLAGPEPPAGPRFDIDLAIEGGDVYAAIAVCESASVPVDVVDVERSWRSMANRIRSSGRILFDRDHTV